MTDIVRLESIFRRLEDAEARLAALEERLDDPTDRVKRHLRKCKVFSARFSTCPDDYYDWSLEQRAQYLSCTTPQLCKTIIFENTMYDASVPDSKTNSRYYCVITQYIGACKQSIYDYSHSRLYSNTITKCALVSLPMQPK